MLNKSKIVEIWTKLFISRAILKAQKRQTTFWKWQDKGNFVIIISRNSLLKLDWQINAANYIKNQDDIQVVLHTVMFRGTPCTMKSFVWSVNLFLIAVSHQTWLSDLCCRNIEENCQNLENDDIFQIFYKIRFQIGHSKPKSKTCR